MDHQIHWYRAKPLQALGRDATPTIRERWPTTWTHQPVHAIDSRCITTSWAPGSQQGGRSWRDLIRRTTRSFRSGGRRARHRNDWTSPDGPSSLEGNDQSATHSWRSATPSRPEGCYAARLNPLHSNCLASRGTYGKEQKVLNITTVDRERRQLDRMSRAALSSPHQNGTRYWNMTG